MPFTLPTFNQLANAWAPGVDPTVNPPTWINLPCQLYANSRFQDNGNASYVVRFPHHVKNAIFATENYLLLGGVMGAGLYLECYQCRYVHMGFPNYYWSVACYTVTWPAGVSVPTELLQ